MPFPPRIFSPEALADARYRYEETKEPIPSIAAGLGIGERTFHTNVNRWGWRKRKQPVPKGTPQPSPAPAQLPGLPEPTPDEEAAAADIELTVHREVAAIRMIVARLQPSTSGVEAERNARALATLTRTLQEVRRLRSNQTPPDSPNDRATSDTDEFLFELARRMDAFADTRLGIGVPDAGGTPPG